MKTTLALLFALCLSANAQEKIVNAYNTMTNLVLLIPNQVNNTVVVEGLTNQFDGAGGVFTYIATATNSVNSSNVFKPTNFGGRWIRNFPTVSSGGGGGGTTLWYQYSSNGTTVAYYTTNALGSALLTNTFNLLAAGGNAAEQLVDQGGSSDIVAIGGTSAAASLQACVLSNSFHIFGAGDGALYDTVITDSSDISGLFDFVLFNGFVFHSGDITGIANNTFQNTILTNCFGVIGFNGALKNASMTNCNNVNGIGLGAGEGIVGTFNNVTFIGNGATATDGTQNQLILGTSMSLKAPGGLSSLATDAPVAITATGITNSLGKLADAYVTGTGVTFTAFNSAGTAVLTNTSVNVTNYLVRLQSGGKITSASGLSGVLVAD